MVLQILLTKGLSTINNPTAQYTKELKTKLSCYRKDQKKLLSRFQVMLDSFLDENPNPTTEELHTAFGPPADMSEMLSNELPSEVKARYAKAQRMRRLILIVLIALLLLFSIYILFINN